MGQQQVLVSSKGVAFDMAGPPPGQCRVCGGNHWEQYCPHANPQGVPQMFQSATGNAAQPHPQQSFQGASPPPAAEGVPQFPNAQAQQHMQSIYREMGFQFGNQGEGQAVAPCTWQMCPSPYEHTSPFRPMNGLTAHCNWQQGRLHQDPGKHTCLPSVSSPKTANHPILLRSHSTRESAQSPGESGVDLQQPDWCPRSECWRNSGSYPLQSSNSTGCKWRPLHASQHPMPPRDPTVRHNTSSSSAGPVSTGRGPACSSSRLAQLSSECVAGDSESVSWEGITTPGWIEFFDEKRGKEWGQYPLSPFLEQWRKYVLSLKHPNTPPPPPKAQSCQVAGMHCAASRKSACNTAPLGTSHGIHGHAWLQLHSGSWEEHWPAWQTGEGGRTSNRPGTMPRHLQTGPCLSSSPYPTLRASQASLHATWEGYPSEQKMSGQGRPGKSEQGPGNPRRSQLPNPSSAKSLGARPVKTGARSQTSLTHLKTPPLPETPQMRAWKWTRIPQTPPPPTP